MKFLLHLLIVHATLHFIMVQNRLHMLLYYSSPHLLLNEITRKRAVIMNKLKGIIPRFLWHYSP